MQEFVAFLDTECGDEAIDRLAHGDASPPEFAEVLGCLDGEVYRQPLKDRKRQKHISGSAKLAVITEAAQNLVQNQSCQTDSAFWQRITEPSSLKRVLSIRSIDPDAAVYDHHAASSSAS